MNDNDKFALRHADIVLITKNLLGALDKRMRTKKSSLTDEIPGPPFARVIFDEIQQFAAAPSGHNRVRVNYNQRVIDATRSIAFRWGLSGTPFVNRAQDVINEMALLGLRVDPLPPAIAAMASKTDQARALANLLYERHAYKLDYGPYTELLREEIEETLEVPITHDQREFFSVAWKEQQQELLALRIEDDANAKATAQQNSILLLRQASIDLMIIDDKKREAVALKIARDKMTTAEWAAHKATYQVSVWWGAAKRADADFFERYTPERYLALAALLRRIPPGDKVLVFTAFTRVIERAASYILANVYGGHAECIGKYEGTSVRSISEREKAEKAFMDPSSAMRVLFINYAAGSVGLNLQIASHVVLLEPWFNSVVEMQAIHRARRPGKWRTPVHVYRMWSPGTVEGYMRIMCRNKRAEWARIRGVDVVDMDDMEAFVEDADNDEENDVLNDEQALAIATVAEDIFGPDVDFEAIMNAH